MSDAPTSHASAPPPMVERLKTGDPQHRPIPPAIAYPADYGLACAATDLIWQYGRDGAINRLIEMAERLSAGEKPGDWVARRRRVDPTERIIAERTQRGN